MQQLHPPSHPRPDGELALVTGAASGIGWAITERFSAGGIPVLALDRSEEGLERLAHALAGRPVHPYVCDVGDAEALPGRVAEMAGLHGPITILVNNAGAWHYEPLVSIPDERWERIFRVNVTAPFVLIREVAPGMMERRGGAIINIASRNAMVSSKGSSAYDASKAALVSLTRTAAGELAPYGIRVNAICPGVIRTPANQDLFDDEEASANYLRLIPLGRYGESEEIAAVACFLASQAAGFITGQAIVADGGQMAFTDWKRLFQKDGGSAP